MNAVDDSFISEVAAAVGAKKEDVANCVRILREQNPTIAEEDLRQLLLSVVPSSRHGSDSLTRRGAA